MARIQEYTIADLKELLNSRRWFAANPLAITRERALSQVNNPRAAPSDVALLVAYEGEAVVAHLGMLPDRAFANQREYKIAWMTAWWTDKRFTGLGAMLLVRALKLYQDGLGGSGFSADSKRVFTAFKKFVTVRELAGLTGFACLDLAERLPRKWRLAARFKWPLRACDWMIHQSSILRQFLWRRRHAIPGSVRIEYFHEFDREAEDYIARHQRHELTRRSAQELNWILRYPWLQPAPLAEPVPYYFSSRVQSYCAHNIKVYDHNDNLVALLMLIAINGHLIVPYCYHDDQALLCARIIGRHIEVLRLKALTSYRADLLEALASLKFPWAWTVRRTRAWVMAGTCARDGMDGYAIQDGDGDLAWTL